MLTTKEILARLKSLRESKDLRQDYIARYLGIDRSTYVRKECGKIPITTEEWLKLAQAMEKAPSYFFTIPGATVFDDPGEKETLLVKLYSHLSEEERADLICGINLMLKNIRKKAVIDTLKILCGT
ncbi:MAG: helix-turn-helix transcriptional regulator [Deltaproteobacteria bacterium]|nr:helix-turn-helix transcriptional regulator [Deltaproteobacteria bacterium]